MADLPWKHVASTVVVGDRGQHVVTRGYMEINGVRFYEDQIVVGSRGQPEISPGWVDVHAAQYGDAGE